MKAVLKEVLQDNQIVPAEWQKLKERSQALGVMEADVRDLAQQVGGLESDLANQIAVLAVRNGTAFDTVRSSYIATFKPGDEFLSPPPLPVLLRAALADSTLDFNKLDGLRALALRGKLPDYGDLREALTAAKVAPVAVDGLMKVIDVSGAAWKSLSSDPVALPLKFTTDAQGQLTPTGDLRIMLVRALTGDGAWSSLEFPKIRALLQPLGRSAAKKLLVDSGFEDSTADQLAKQFTASNADYSQRMPQDIRFRRDGKKFVLDVPSEVEPPKATGAPPVTIKFVGDATPVGDYNFKSGVTAPADRQLVDVQGRQIPMIRPNRDEDLLLRFGALINVNNGLSPVPTQHIALIRQIVVDPGVLQDAAADAGYDGVVTLYWGTAGGGPQEPQRVMVHEVGHLVSFKAGNSDPSFWNTWQTAAKDDDAAVSLYGTTNRLEDFAEAYLMFIMKQSAAKTQFPHRSAIIAALVNPAPPSPTPQPKKP
jgi:hypothetical protein